ncbi:MAG: hypothetical protein ACOZBW_12085 [Thermodesulfobacteriota bacterium]
MAVTSQSHGSGDFVSSAIAFEWKARLGERPLNLPARTFEKPVYTPE